MQLRYPNFVVSINREMNTAKMDILVGLQWGDEGKGKFIDHICPDYDIVARFNGGANAGHTIFWKEQKVTLQLLPSGIFYPHIRNVIGTGTVIDPVQLKKEIEQLALSCPGLTFKERLLISQKAHLVLPTDRYQDQYFENSDDYRTIGTTKNGIGCAYVHKLLRQGLRVTDIYNDDFADEVTKTIQREYRELKEKGQEMLDFDEMMQNFLSGIDYLKQLSVIDTELFLNTALKAGNRILAEGAQATLLDIDHGSYPYVTSSNTIASAACVGLGVPPSKVGEIFGVLKAYATRVGDGPFPSELKDQQADELRIKGNEFGSNTGRPRRTGWLDLPALKYAVMLNGVTQLIITKADVLNGMETVELCEQYEVNGELQAVASTGKEFSTAVPQWKSFKGWEANFSAITSEKQLSQELRTYISFLSHALETPVSHLSIGPKREDIITLENRTEK